MLAAVIILLLIPVVAVVAVVGLALGGAIDVGSGFDVTYKPLTVSELPTSIEHGAGEVVLDLTELDGADFENEAEPVAIQAELDFGSLQVIVPEGLEIDVDAEADLGEVAVFSSSQGGFDLNLEIPADDPDIDLELRLGVGEIDVVRR